MQLAKVDVMAPAASVLAVADDENTQRKIATTLNAAAVGQNVKKIQLGYV